LFLLNLPDIVLAALLELNLQLTVWQWLKAVDAVKMILEFWWFILKECNAASFCFVD
jgi:hypothetical protein